MTRAQILALVVLGVLFLVAVTILVIQVLGAGLELDELPS